MLTKGIIISQIIDSNKYLIRIPFLETAGFGEKQYEAILSHEPFSYNSYLPGDVVIVGFEDHDGSKPIILGKLSVGIESPVGFANLNSLNVSNKVTLPEDTTIGDYSYNDFVRFTNKLNDVNERVNSEVVKDIRGELSTLVDDVFAANKVGNSDSLTFVWNGEYIVTYHHLGGPNNAINMLYINNLTHWYFNGDSSSLTFSNLMAPIYRVEEQTLYEHNIQLSAVTVDGISFTRHLYIINTSSTPLHTLTNPISSIATSVRRFGSTLTFNDSTFRSIKMNLFSLNLIAGSYYAAGIISDITRGTGEIPSYSVGQIIQSTTTTTTFKVSGLDIVGDTVTKI